MYLTHLFCSAVRDSSNIAIPGLCPVSTLAIPGLCPVSTLATLGLCPISTLQGGVPASENLIPGHVKVQELCSGYSTQYMTSVPAKTQSSLLWDIYTLCEGVLL